MDRIDRAPRKAVADGHPASASTYWPISSKHLVTFPFRFEMLPSPTSASSLKGSWTRFIKMLIINTFRREACVRIMGEIWTVQYASCRTDLYALATPFYTISHRGHNGVGEEDEFPPLAKRICAKTGDKRVVVRCAHTGARVLHAPFRANAFPVAGKTLPFALNQRSVDRLVACVEKTGGNWKMQTRECNRLKMN